MSQGNVIIYLTTRPVIRDDNDTNKLRIIFDALAKTNEPSLNECFHKGPQLPPLIFDIFLRFRTFVIALSADIEKGFLQMDTNPNDMSQIRFLGLKMSLLKF